MSYPNVIYGRFGEEKRAQSTAIGGLPLGQLMVTPDGREFVHALADTAAALAPGLAVVGKARAGTIVNVVAGSSTAIGGTTVVLTMPATTLCTIADQYAGGFLTIDDADGEGYCYKIKSSNTAAGASTATFTLEPTDPIKVAIATGSSECIIKESPYYKVLTRAAGTASVGQPAGVAPTAVSAGYYCWLQRKGNATLLSAGTIAVTGRKFACATVTAGGFAAHNPIPADTTLAPVAEDWGTVVEQAAASTEYFMGFLELP